MRKSEQINNIFTENYDGILTHKGTLKVAKSNITGRILDIYGNNVLIRGNKRNSYSASIHKDLKPHMRYVEKGDTGFIKWKNGEAWIVGFKKKPKKKDKSKKQTDWITFFEKMEMEI